MERQEEKSQVRGGNVAAFAELMEEVAAMPKEQQERLSFIIQGYVAAAQVRTPRQAEVIV